jgi:hypothetical protein
MMTTMMQNGKCPAPIFANSLDDCYYHDGWLQEATKMVSGS